MNNDFFNPHFILPNPDFSKMFRMDELKDILSDNNLNTKIRIFFSRNDYLCSKNFNFITWNTFSERTYKEQKQRPDEETKVVRERVKYLTKYIEKCINRDVVLEFISYNNDFYLYNALKYPNHEFFIRKLNN